MLLQSQDTGMPFFIRFITTTIPQMFRLKAQPGPAGCNAMGLAPMINTQTNKQHTPIYALSLSLSLSLLLSLCCSIPFCLFLPLFLCVAFCADYSGQLFSFQSSSWHSNSLVYICSLSCSLCMILSVNVSLCPCLSLSLTRSLSLRSRAYRQSLAFMLELRALCGPWLLGVLR